MSIIVEDGTVVANANSFCSVAYADTYHGDRLYSSAWTATSTPTASKEKALMSATSMLDTMVKWSGTKTDVDSSLSWPRTGVVTTDGQSIGENTIPKFLLNATAELALSILVENRLAESDVSGFNEITVGAITLKPTSAAAHGTMKSAFPRSVVGFIAPYGRFSSGYGSVPLVRS